MNYGASARVFALLLLLAHATATCRTETQWTFEREDVVCEGSGDDDNVVCAAISLPDTVHCRRQRANDTWGCHAESGGGSGGFIDGIRVDCPPCPAPMDECTAVVVVHRSLLLASVGIFGFSAIGLVVIVLVALMRWLRLTVHQAELRRRRQHAYGAANNVNVVVQQPERRPRYVATDRAPDRAPDRPVAYS